MQSARSGGRAGSIVDVVLLGEPRRSDVVASARDRNKNAQHKTGEESGKRKWGVGGAAKHHLVELCPISYHAWISALQVRAHTHTHTRAQYRMYTDLPTHLQQPMSDRCTCRCLVQPGSEHLVSLCSSQAPRVCVCVCVIQGPAAQHPDTTHIVSLSGVEEKKRGV